MDVQEKYWLDVLMAVIAMMAMVFAAVSSWASMQSAKFSKASVQEARISRRIEMAPKLVLEKSFFDLSFFWPHPDSLNGEAVFLSRKHWKDKDLTPPEFTLDNFGQNPAIDLTITWELEDPNGNYVVPDIPSDLGISVNSMIGLSPNDVPINILRYGFQGPGSPLYKKWTTDIPSCAPGHRRVVDFPVGVLNILFLRGLQFGSTIPKNDGIFLTAKISCYGVDSDHHEKIFKWKIMPFHHYEVSPVIVYAHFHECPVNSKPLGSRVAS